MDSAFPRGRAQGRKQDGAGPGRHRGDTLTTLVTATSELGPRAPADHLVGRVLEGRYQILRPLDRGGMATVYEARDHRLERDVAVKVMHPSLAHDPQFVARFRREATSAASIRHPHVVAVTDAGTDGDVVFLVMELVRGRTLRALLVERGRLVPAQALELTEAVLDALGAAHAAGLVHRDVKPENVLLGDDGTIAVADFGLARAVEASSLTTHAGLLLGTVAYVAPEQVSRGVADARSDVYAAGILLFELLTGAVPYVADTPVAVAYRHVHERVPAPSTLVRGLPPELDDLVRTATSPEPADRYRDGSVFLVALRAARARVLDRLLPDQPRAARPARGGDTRAITLPEARPRPPAPPAVAAPPPDDDGSGGPVAARRRRRWPLVLLVVLLLTAAAIVGGVWLGRDARTHIPALTDRRLGAVEAALEARHLTYTVMPAEASDAVPAGLVVTTQPSPGTSVTLHSTVLIRPSAGAARLTVPTAVGQTQAAATAALEATGFPAPQVASTYSDTVAAGTVVAVTPTAGSTVDHRTVLRLQVCAGPQPVTIPATAGRSQADAIRALTSLGLKTTVTQQFSDTVPSGTVIAATPPSGAGHRGDTVALVVSKGPQTVAVPDITGLDGGQAATQLRKAGLVPREIALFGIHGGTVVTQKQKPGATVLAGSTVTYYTAY